MSCRWQSDDDTPGIDFSMAYQGSGSSGSMAKGRRRWTRDEVILDSNDKSKLDSRNWSSLVWLTNTELARGNI